MSLIVDAIRDISRRGRSNRTRSGSSTRSNLAWPRLEDVKLPDRRERREKSRKKELTTRRKKWVLALIGAVFAVPVIWLVGGALYGLATMGSRFDIPYSAGTQSPPLTATQPAQPNQASQPGTPPETQTKFEVLLQTGDKKVAVEVGPGLDWTIQSNKRFFAHDVAEGSRAEGPEHEMPAGASGWGGAVRRGVLIVRGVEDDTRIQFFRQ